VGKQEHQPCALAPLGLAGENELVEGNLGAVDEVPELRLPEDEGTGPLQRVAGKAVYLAGSKEFAPPAMIGCLKHNKVLHEEVAVLTILTTDTPRVRREDKVTIETLQAGIYRITARFGFMEEPSVPYVLALVRERGPDFPLEDTSFFLGRERLLPAKRPRLGKWRTRVFAFMSRNALGATTTFAIPPERVIEVGSQMKL